MTELTTQSQVTSWSESSSLFSSEVVIALAVIVAVIVFITVIGNLLVVLSFMTTKKLRNYNNYFILSLAVSDLVVGAIDMPLFAIVFITGRWPFGEVFCDIFSFLDHTFAHVSIVLVTIISLERWVAVSFPFHHRRYWRRRSRAMLLIAIGYAIPVLIWLPSTALWQYLRGNERRAIPADVCEPQYLESVVFSFLSPILYLFIPFAITAVLCTRISVIIWQIQGQKAKTQGTINHQRKTDRQFQNGAPSTSNTSSSQVIESDVGTDKSQRPNETGSPDNIDDEQEIKQKTRKDNFKGLRTLSFIVCAMVISWGPSAVTIIISSFCADCLPGFTYSVTVFWGYMNSMLNPVCYALADQIFKQSFMSIITLKCLR
ncbi:muscarinic acetylcholine receptor M1-like [Diadema antillarum]|uniref:muscarinic acetylcholine receptor M1-like n=1 Tax=Diadema antillarum TaxID=105358 RepID=UPI003A836F75